jgi:hypothetical protein
MNNNKRTRLVILVWGLTLAAVLACGSGDLRAGYLPAQEAQGIQVTENNVGIQISTSALQATVVRRGFITGVSGRTLVDKKTGFRDVGFGLDSVDCPLESGSDYGYRDQLSRYIIYNFNDIFHGKIAKRWTEGPQICTAGTVHPELIRGKNFVAVRMSFTYNIAAPGRKAGSEWTQTMVFPEGKRYFISADRLTTVNASPDLALRTDMPGHIKHNKGDTFSEIYLSYYGKIPSSLFLSDFAPDEKFRYYRGSGQVPERFIRAYHLRDEKTGQPGPWLAGMTLDPTVVSDAWCHERSYRAVPQSGEPGYVCMIEEFGGRPVQPGDSFSAAFLIGYFDSIDEMNEVYDRYKGHDGLIVDGKDWRLTSASRPRPQKK